MINENHGTVDRYAHEHYKCFSWSAIVVGALIGIGLSFLLSLFSVAIGMSVVTTSKEGMVSLAVGGFIGLLISSIASMFVAGTAAGYMGRSYCVKRNLGVLYGFTTWCLALALTAFLTSYMEYYISNYSTFITHQTAVAASHNASAISQMNQEIPAVVTVNTPKTTTDMGATSFLMFVLFFVSALASCFGGHYGMACDTIFCRKTYVIPDIKP